MPDFAIERECLNQGFPTVAGVDEVGRGALFGPVVAAALSFPPEFYGENRPPWTEAIDDSKRLSPTKRKALIEPILGAALSLGVGMASSAEIDAMNIYRASGLAMKRAVEALVPRPDMVLVDGFLLKELDYPQKAVRQGDRKSVSIAAASIVAKVVRDDLMDVFDICFGGYGLAKHKGYGTAGHYLALRTLGPTVLHRKSFDLKIPGA